MVSKSTTSSSTATTATTTAAAAAAFAVLASTTSIINVENVVAATPIATAAAKATAAGRGINHGHGHDRSDCVDRVFAHHRSPTSTGGVIETCKTAFLISRGGAAVGADDDDDDDDDESINTLDSNDSHHDTTSTFSLLEDDQEKEQDNGSQKKNYDNDDTEQNSSSSADKTKKNGKKKKKKKKTSTTSIRKKKSSKTGQEEEEEEKKKKKNIDDDSATFTAKTKRKTKRAGAGAGAGGGQPKPSSTEHVTDQSKQQQHQSPTQKDAPSAQDILISDILQQDDYYDILGISRTSSSSRDIQKAYRKRAVQTHPDKVDGNDRRAFDKVSEAYDVLSDESKRRLYDRYGKRGLDPTQGGGGGGGFPAGSAQDIFRNFFGQQQQQQQQRHPRNRNIHYELEVSLEQLYTGKTESLLVEIGGARRKRVEVCIGKGMSAGSTIVLSGENDILPHATPGDITFVLVERPHPLFRRKGHDLAIEIEITLREALCGTGVTRELKHLDGRVFTIRSAESPQQKSSPPPPHDDDKNTADGVMMMMIQTGDVHVLKGEGMPKLDSTTGEYGDLFVQYRVAMPKTIQSQNSMDHPLNSEERRQLGILLEKLEGRPTATKEENDDDDTNIRYMTKSSPKEFGKNAPPPPRRRQQQQQHFFFSNGSSGFGSSAAAEHAFGGGPFFGGNPFTGPADGGSDDANVQCQQM